MRVSRRATDLSTKTLTYAVLLAGSVSMLLPFLWMVSTALKQADKVMAYPPQWIPHPVVWRNFADGWASLPFGLYLRNTPRSP